MKRAAAALFLSLLTGAALAQPVPAKDDPALETVIVTAPKLHMGVTPNAIAHDFVRSFAAPTALRDSIARWEVPICPDFQGIAPQFARVMNERFRAIAAQASAPVKDQGCRANLFVVFTPHPQDYLDTLHVRNVEALGYHGATKITHPIQAWYVTGTKDIRGLVVPDQDGTLALEGGNWTNGPLRIASGNTARIVSVGGWHFRPDATSDLLYVTVIVDSQRAATYTVSEIADYVALLALSRTEDYDDCQLVPSIANLMSANCDDKLKPDRITASDVAYLRGIYKMDAGATLAIQQDQIAAEIAKTLEGR